MSIVKLCVGLKAITTSPDTVERFCLKQQIFVIFVFQVTFAYLEEREESKNKDGHYIMKFSKAYNYLDPEEREDLMEPLILLSLLQNNPKFLLL